MARKSDGQAEGDRPKRITLSTLKSRGWTDGAVRKHLGEPDLLTKNPNYASGPPMKLYLLDRVEKVEASEAWREWHEKSQARREKASATMKARHDKARKELHERLRRMPMTVPQMSMNKLFAVAVEHRNEIAEDRAFRRDYDTDFSYATLKNAEPLALQRWAVNYLRHQETHYDALLDAMTGRVGVDEAKRLIRNRVLAAIAEQYPELSAECQRQSYGQLSQLSDGS